MNKQVPPPQADTLAEDAVAHPAEAPAPAVQPWTCPECAREWARGEPEGGCTCQFWTDEARRTSITPTDDALDAVIVSYWKGTGPIQREVYRGFAREVLALVSPAAPTAVQDEREVPTWAINGQEKAK